MLEASLRHAPASIARILDGVLSGGRLSVPDAAVLLRARGSTGVIAAAADIVRYSKTETSLFAQPFNITSFRQRDIGDNVTYVVNRNINFTNVCVKKCGF